MGCTGGAGGAEERETVNCVFCKIVNKQLASEIVYEDDEFVCFKDARPMARGHYQLVPRTHYKNVNVLTASDIPLVQRMMETGNRVMQQIDPAGEHKFSFHRPPFNSVEHLHMHCIALPLTGFMGYIKHHLNNSRWSVSPEHVIRRLEKTSRL